MVTSLDMFFKNLDMSLGYVVFLAVASRASVSDESGDLRIFKEN
jgi:hypothetical protein